MKYSISPWIFNNFQKDFFYLILPPFLMLAISFCISAEGAYTLLLSFITFSIVDNGHVYMTIMRTYANIEERTSSLVYWIAPFFIFLGFSLWLFLGGYYFWHFVVYATLFHNIRQFYGITRWYQKKEKNHSPWPGRFLYILTFLPVLAYHFRDNVLTGMYAETDIFYHPNSFSLSIVSSVYIALLVFWFFYEGFLFYKKQNSPGRFLSLFTPIAAYGISFFFGKTYLQVLGAVIIGHGISYGALMAYSLQKTQPKKYFSFRRTFIFLLGIAIIFGIMEMYAEEFLSPWIDAIGSMESIPMAGIFFIALYLTPLFCHYFFDGFLWKSSHREAKLIYN